jgi:hypothetical protein
VLCVLEEESLFINFYKQAIIEPFSREDEEKFLIFTKLVPPGKKLKVKLQDNGGLIRKDLFDFGVTQGLNDEKDETEDAWVDKDFAFQLAYEMEDLKSLNWYERIVTRCDRLKERQILLRARGEVIELKNTGEEPKNKGAFFSRLVRTYAEERGISLGDYASSLKKDEKFGKRDIIKRKRREVNKFAEELKSTLSVEELCHYHQLALQWINKEYGRFFLDNGIDIPPHVINSYMNRVIARDYGLKLPKSDAQE